MAPRTRQSARSFSQESTTRRSRRLASEEPEYEADQLAVVQEITTRNSDLESRIEANEVTNASLQVRAQESESLNTDFATRYSALATHNEDLAARIHQLQVQRDEAEARARALEEAAISNDSVAKRKRSIYDDAMQERIQKRIMERKAEAASTASPSPVLQNAPEPPFTARPRAALSSSQRTPRARNTPRTPRVQKEIDTSFNGSMSTATSTFAPTDTFAQTPTDLVTGNQATPQQQFTLSTRKGTPAARRNNTASKDTTAEDTSSVQDSSMALTQVASPPQQLDLQQASTTPATQNTPRPLWRRMFGAAVGILGELTPASRKRAADDDTPTNTDRPAKAQRSEASSHGMENNQQGYSPVAIPQSSTPQPSSQKDIKPRDTAQSEIVSQRTSSAQGSSQHDAAAEQESYDPSASQHTTAPTGILSGLAQSSPSKARTPSRFLMPSTKDRRVPTSLSTVSEYTEPVNSFVSTFTPSRPPQRRSVASARASRAQSSTPWSDRRKAATQAVSSGPDARWEKLERVRNLREELDRLNSDSDVIEMESHRRKRVKVDSLAWIPHHRPGESSGTFRVPDIDSDDEMEVDETVPERSNVFAEAEEMEKEVEEDKVVEGKKVREENKVVEEEEEEEEEEVNEFVFPDVGRRQPDEPELAAGLIRQEHERLESGFRAFLAVNDLVF